MAIEMKQVEYAKQVDDVMVLVIELVKNRKAGAEMTSLIDELMTAIGGIEEIPAEAANRKVLLQTVGFRSGELTDAFLG